LTVSILHIGLPLDYPSIPVEERPKLTKRLHDLRERMTRAGYKYEITHASPETGLDVFQHQLRTQPCDGVLIGGGVVGDPAMSYFMEQIVDVTHQVALKRKLCFTTTQSTCAQLLSAGSDPGLTEDLLFRKR
jgi:hypothetical protein